MTETPSTGAAPIHVALVDDQALIRSGLAMLIDSQPDLEVVAQASDGREAAASVAVAGADVVLTDVRMPGMDGVTVMHEIQRLRPGLPVVMMSGHTDVVADEMIAEGASAWVDKPFTDPDKVIQTLLSVTAKSGR